MYLISFIYCYYFYFVANLIGKLPKLNDIIGVKSLTDDCFYRAKVIKKINEDSYDVQFIDYGIQENVSLSEIVPLSSELKQVRNLLLSSGTKF